MAEKYISTVKKGNDTFNIHDDRVDTLTSNFVTTNTSQTISGAKYFSGILSADSVFSGTINNRRGINSETKVSASENLNNVTYNTYLLTDSINSEFLINEDELKAKFSIYLDNDGQAFYKIKHTIYTYDPDYGDYTNIEYNYDLPRGSGTLALQSDAPSYQSTSVVVGNAITNINGRVFQNYTATLVTSGNYVYYQIYKNGSIVTNKNTAKEYMHYMTGSYFVPEYHYDFPKQTLFVFADRSIWKPQFDETNGLRLYRVSTPLALESDCGTKLYKHVIKRESGPYLVLGWVVTKSSTPLVFTDSVGSGATYFNVSPDDVVSAYVFLSYMHRPATIAQQSGGYTLTYYDYSTSSWVSVFGNNNASSLSDEVADL